MCNIVSESFARKLLTTRLKVNIALSGIGGAVNQAKGSIIATVQSKSASFSSPMEFVILKSPCVRIPTAPIDVAAWSFPNVPLADPTFHMPSNVDVVIGSDAYWELHTGKKRLLVKGGPWLVETPFGWTVAGNTSHNLGSTHVSYNSTTSNKSRDTLLERSWENECNLDGPALSLKENACEKHYVATTTRDDHERDIVCLPHLKEGRTAWEWDRALPGELQQAWRSFHSTLYSLRELRVPRFVSQPQTSSLQLHKFADASQSAYSACCDVRANSTSIATVQLLAAKSKIVSLSNTQLIARLELCAARLAIQLFQKVSRALTASTMAYCWTDSMTVMHWLDSPPRRWKPFVAIRVAQIQEETRIAEWRHVPGCDNPADDISRGPKPEELPKFTNWWQAPDWLTYSQDAWPKRSSAVEDNAYDTEERVTVSGIVTVATRCEFRDKLFERYSSYNKLERVVGYCLRFMACMKRAERSRVSRKKPPRTCKLELAVLTKEKRVFLKSRLKGLSPYIDHAGTLRVGGRLGSRVTGRRQTSSDFVSEASVVGAIGSGLPPTVAACRSTTTISNTSPAVLGDRWSKPEKGCLSSVPRLFQKLTDSREGRCYRSTNVEKYSGQTVLDQRILSSTLLEACGVIALWHAVVTICVLACYHRQSIICKQRTRT